MTPIGGPHLEVRGRERDGEREAGWACWAGLVAWAAGKRKRGGEKGVGWSERRRERECLFILF